MNYFRPTEILQEQEIIQHYCRTELQISVSEYFLDQKLHLQQYAGITRGIRIIPTTHEHKVSCRYIPRIYTGNQEVGIIIHTDRFLQVYSCGQEYTQESKIKHLWELSAIYSHTTSGSKEITTTKKKYQTSIHKNLNCSVYTSHQEKYSSNKPTNFFLAVGVTEL